MSPRLRRPQRFEAVAGFAQARQAGDQADVFRTQEMNAELGDQLVQRAVGMKIRREDRIARPSAYVR